MKKDKPIKLNEIFLFERPLNYKPPFFITVEDEIKNECKKNNIIVDKILKYDGYKVIGKKK